MNPESAQQRAETFVLNFFSALGPLPESRQELLCCDYIQTGRLDSFGVFTLIMEIETRLGLNLEQEDLEAPAFKTLGGLIDILIKRLTQTSGE